MLSPASARPRGSLQPSGRDGADGCRAGRARARPTRRTKIRVLSILAAMAPASKKIQGASRLAGVRMKSPQGCDPGALSVASIHNSPGSMSSENQGDTLSSKISGSQFLSDAARLRLGSSDQLRNRFAEDSAGSGCLLIQTNLAPMPVATLCWPWILAIRQQ